MVGRRACDNCHKRKIHCDSTDQKVPCNWCSHHDLACTFARPKRGQNKKIRTSSGISHNTLQSLSIRLEQIEGTLTHVSAQRTQPTTVQPLISSRCEPPASASPDAHAESISTGSSSPGGSSESIVRCPIQPEAWMPVDRPSSLSLAARLAPGSHATSVDLSQLYFGGCHFGKISPKNGVPILSEQGRRWISLMTGKDASFDRFQPAGIQETSISLSAGIHLPGSHPAFNSLCVLPDRYIVYEAVQAYDRSADRFLLLPLDPVLFAETIGLAYDTEEPLRLDRITARCCVLAFLSVAFLFRHENSVLPDIDSNIFGSRAQHMLSFIIEESSPTSLQAMVMLCFFQCCTGQFQSAALIHSLACRATMTLGGHVYRPTPPFEVGLSHSERQSRQLRVSFWLCYVLDKDLSLRLSQPPLLHDDYCDLTLPEGYNTSHIFVARPDGPDRAAPCGTAILYPGELVLSRLKEKIFRLLYSAAAANKPRADLLRDIRQLDEELETWRQSIHPYFRPSLSISDTAGANSNHVKRSSRSMRKILMNLEYHHLMITIHRASSRFAVPPAKDRCHETSSPYDVVVQSSLDLVLEASRSTLRFLRTATSGLPKQAFWLMVFYPTTAMLPLYLNVLRDPMTPQAESDHDLLLSVVQTISEVPLLEMTQSEISYMKLIDGYAHELVRLGNCAIARQRERRAHQSVP